MKEANDAVVDLSKYVIYHPNAGVVAKSALRCTQRHCQTGCQPAAPHLQGDGVGTHFVYYRKLRPSRKRVKDLDFLLKIGSAYQTLYCCTVAFLYCTIHTTKMLDVTRW